MKIRLSIAYDFSFDLQRLAAPYTADCWLRGFCLTGMTLALIVSSSSMLFLFLWSSSSCES